MPRILEPLRTKCLVELAETDVWDAFQADLAIRFGAELLFAKQFRGKILFYKQPTTFADAVFMRPATGLKYTKTLVVCIIQGANPFL